MIEDRIFQIVRDHYRAPGAELLLLSVLGARLSKAGVWPQAAEKRTLFEVVESVNNISLVCDPEVQSFIAVVLRGDERRAFEAIDKRRKHYLLRELPKPLLLAFTQEAPQGQTIFVRLEPRISYSYGPPIENDAIAVDDDLRLPGLEITNPTAMRAADVEQLEANLKRWCERHLIDLPSLARRHGKTFTLHSGGPTQQSNALERLYSAQSSDVAQRMCVPIDIALVLSRIP